MSVCAFHKTREEPPSYSAHTNRASNAKPGLLGYYSTASEFSFHLFLRIFHIKQPVLIPPPPLFFISPSYIIIMNYTKQPASAWAASSKAPLFLCTGRLNHSDWHCHPSACQTHFLNHQGRSRLIAAGRAAARNPVTEFRLKAAAPHLQRSEGPGRAPGGFGALSPG